MFDVVHKSKKDPEVLVVTPLLPIHKISKETRIGLLRNNIEFDWVSYSSIANTPKNASLALDTYRARFPKSSIKYVMMVDRDIIPSRNLLRNMFETLSRSKDEIAYTYVGFSFGGHLKNEFQGRDFDPMKLLEANYISSNSMIKLEKLDEIGGFVVDEKYKRLLDWCLWLKFLSYGYHGELTKNGNFVAISEKDSVSAGSAEEYRLKASLIREEIIKPMLDGLIF